MKLPEIPIEEVLTFLVDLLNTRSPTGDTEAAQTFITQAVEHLPLSIAPTRKGGLRLTWSGDNRHPKALTAHVDAGRNGAAHQDQRATHIYADREL